MLELQRTTEVSDSVIRNLQILCSFGEHPPKLNGLGMTATEAVGAGAGGRHWGSMLTL